MCLLAISLSDAGSSSGGGSSDAVIIGVVVGIVLVLLVLFLVYLYRHHTVRILITSHTSSHKRFTGSATPTSSLLRHKAVSISTPVVGVSYHTASDGVSFSEGRRRAETTTVLTPEMIGGSSLGCLTMYLIAAAAATTAAAAGAGTAAAAVVVVIIVVAIAVYPTSSCPPCSPFS